MMSEMDGLIPAVANLSVQSSLRRKPVRPASSIPPPPTFCAELEGSMPTTPRPQASGDFDQGLIPVEREPPPDHEGLIPLHAPHSAAVSHAGPPSTTVGAGLPSPSQTPGIPGVVYTPAAYPSWPQSYASHHPQPAPLVSPTHSLPTPSVSSTTSPPPIPGSHSSGQKLGDFASSVFSKETVKWSKKTASRFGGALKSAATSAHEAATKAQVAAVRAAEQRRQRQAGIVVPQQTTSPQPLYTPQYWASSHHHAQNTASHQQSAIPFVPPARQDQSQSQSPAALAPVSQGQTPHVFASNQTPSSPPPPLAKFRYPQISASPLSLPSHPQPHYSLPGHHLQQHQQHQQQQQQQHQHQHQQHQQQHQQEHQQHHIAEHQHRERPPLGESPQTGDKLDKIRSASPSTSSILSKRSDFYLSTSTGFDPRSDEGRMLADSTGTSRYLGASSGATFLDNIKNMITLTTPLAALISKGPEHMFSQTTGRYQTDDSRALLGPPLMDPVRHLPPAPDMAKLLDEVRYFIQDGTTDDLFPSGGIMFWSFPTFTDLSALGTARRDRIVTAHGEQYLQVPRDDEQRTPLALTFAAFAFNSLLGLAGKDSRVNGRLGEDFYATSRHLLGDPWDFGTSTIKEAAVMGLLALYLVEINRRDNAHLWVKHAMHVCEVRGIHRGYTDDEAEVRTFWTLYIIDSWLSCLLGRTPSIPDDGISLRPPRECPHFPSPVGLKAHLELSRITHKIIYNGLRRQSDGKKPEDRRARAESHVKRSLESLKKWLKALPPALQLPPDAHTKLHLPNSLTTEEVPSGFGRDRACWSLHMSYNQLIILTVRPVILTAVRKAIASLVSTGQMFNIYDNALVEEIRWCTDAAQSNLRLGWLMRQNSPHGRLLVQDLHHIFNAAVFLTMYQLVFVNVRTQLVADVDWAIDVFKQEQETGCAYAKDCFEVLRDLRFLVSELRDWIHNQTEKEKLWDDDGALKNYLGAMTAPRNNNTSKTDLGADVPMHDVQFEGRPIKQAHGFKKGYARRIWDTLTSWLLLEDNSNEGDGGGECFVFLSSSSSDTNSNCSFPPGGY